ncbi:32873_t:CDS:2 [Gigaspora margarita]|uniref:32873_t:CDS:1 n=1 Tax=Gigaspora margarita TaxID=4874 RepID=A0ABN7ULJ2_GIGMA|nr:32873_t:CDS:2 [Gigaspora margarita]
MQLLQNTDIETASNITVKLETNICLAPMYSIVIAEKLQPIGTVAKIKHLNKKKKSKSI